MSVVDAHFHIFATDDVPGCRLSTRARYRPSGIVAGCMLRILDDGLHDDLGALFRPHRAPARHQALTSALIRDRLLEEIRGCGHLDGVVLLALDAVYDSETGKQQPSDVVVTNDWVQHIITAHHGEADGKRLYLGASVNPHRADWRQELDRIQGWGAKLIKWIPSSQRIDPADWRLGEFYRELALREIPLLCHAGPEDAVPDEPRRWWPPWKRNAWELFNHPRRLVPALEAGVTVIVAHCASPYLPWYALDSSQKNYVPTLADMFDEADRRGWKLYADISALLLTPWRAGKVRRLFAPPYVKRLIYGSDFPIPTSDFSCGRLRLDANSELADQASSTDNLLDRDVLAKRSVGVPEEVMERTAHVLRIA